MSQQQYQAEVMDELEMQEYNTNFGIGDSSVNLHGRRNSSADGQVRSLGEVSLLTRQTKGR
jgi:hypothetical protein